MDDRELLEILCKYATAKIQIYHDGDLMELKPDNIMPVFYLTRANAAKLILKPLSELSKGSHYRTNLHEIAIELGILKDDNMLFQNNFEEDYRNRKNYILLDSEWRTLIEIPKDGNYQNLRHGVFQKLIEKGYDLFNLIKQGKAKN